MQLFQCSTIYYINMYGVPEIDAFPKPTIMLSLFFDEEAITTVGGLLNLFSAGCWSLTFVAPT